MTRYSNGQPLGVGGGYPDPSDAGDYLRGDRTWADLNKAAVGLGNVDNTSDANKPISTETQSALNQKVTGPSSSVSGNVPIFSGTTGKTVVDSGYLFPTAASETAALAAATAGGTMGVEGQIADSPTYTLASEGGIWVGKTYTFFGFNKDFGSSYTSTSANDGPATTLFSFAQNTGSNRDVVAFLGDAVARVDNATVFAGNFIARNGSSINGAKLVGVEIDVEPASGTTIASGSGGLLLNMFSIASSAPAILVGGVGGGTWGNGLVIGSVSGAGVSPNGAATGMNSLLNTGSATYDDDAVILSNQHKLRLSGTASTHGKLWMDGSNNIRLVLGSGIFAIRDSGDTTSVYTFAAGGVLTFGTGTINLPTAQSQTTVGAAGGASALPATPTGYMRMQVNGTTFAVPYYAAS